MIPHLCFSRIINLLLTKLAQDRTGRISALGLFCTDLAALGPYCQDLGPIFSQYGSRAWLIRYMYLAQTIQFAILFLHITCVWSKASADRRNQPRFTAKLLLRASSISELVNREPVVKFGLALSFAEVVICTIISP